uniref:Calcium-dependent protein kinase n=1 Tax=Chlamydomonas chlamydogama TaxID=225041 RepID=A0A7S2QUP0_9CHLO|mmetsp:Transcript_457/g.945  ORF Transcript_457/g.945 Transcript_457/m.945 type:complete len:596 (+) Transcript_457:106-1893(+)|eukprot:CAMPEP_0202890524 /NCGR_PEP_ID=MMETSP1392-20130828/893_1 /ASSEMBLY_ACC=CAM_ASM_000868 /TAXON_ID=225041 /ORGANISM="Chlamydomonas chlamydogama, Strain SAG 11-48b" /LENGTH=595 /DNA_ID=CAMNT_0049574107 /DNA_START=106 /DNA_END=1893 /DNA_ORIENTATION=+
MAKQGQLQVTLMHATDLKDVEFLGRQDPYCVLAVGDKNFRSKTHTDGGKNPTWNESFEFPTVTSEHYLKLEFFDENMVLRDVPIGGCKIPLNQVAVSGTEEVCVPVVTRKGKHRGDVYLRLVFKAGNKTEAAAKATSKPGTWILPTYANTDCWKDYEPGAILGKGTFGTTYLATRKGTPEKYAVKVISKRKLSTPEEVEDVRREVQIMHHLAGHPNVVCLKNVYEDKSNVCLVMEVCSGGELFDSIVKRGHYTEKDASSLIRTIVGVVAHCHNMGVIHRDLKPENFLLSDKSPGAQLKATDFGLSSFFQEGQVFTDIVGSAYYVAPEVLRRAYGKEADIWSCGVILYILLCGYPPFHGDNEKKIFEAVISKAIDFTTDPWPKISEPAKDCVRRMLVRDPKRRATAQQILQHDWMRENGVATDNELEMEVLTRMKRFSAMNRLKKEALKIIATSLPMDEISGMKEIFKDMDKDKSGSITVEEFAQALRRKGNSLPEQEVQRLIAEADMDGSGTIDYEEFLAATINHSKLQREEHLKAAFEHFDIDKDGHITHAELMESLKKLGITDEGIQDIIKEVDKDNSGTIEYNEFCAMMRNL